MWHVCVCGRASLKCLASAHIPVPVLLSWAVPLLMGLTWHQWETDCQLGMASKLDTASCLAVPPLLQADPSPAVHSVG